MKIERVVFHNYKSIAEDCTLDLDTRITTLVGASESGKTNVLEALNKFFIPAAYHDADICTFSDSQIDENYKMVSVTFRLEDTDLEAVSKIDERISEAGRFTISKQKSGSYILEEPEARPKEPQLSQKLIELHDSFVQKLEQINATLTQFYSSLPEITPEQQDARQALDVLIEHMPLSGSPPRPTRSEEEAYLEKAIDLAADFFGKLEAAQDTPAELQKIASMLNSELEEAASLPHKVTSDEDSAEESAPKQLLELCPNVIFKADADIHLLDDSIPISELEANTEQASAYVALLDLAGLPVDALKLSDPTIRNRQLSRGAERITRLLQKIWNQEKLKASFVVHEATAEFVFDVEGKEGHIGKLSDRSRGFCWFLSFYLGYVSPQDVSRGSILLLDEPGLHLHASAQKDLLDQFEQAAQTNLIIYTTHSPFMINKNHPDRIRGVLKAERPQGTSIDNKPYRVTKGGCYEPIRTAIGITLGNSLFIGGRNLIVEGIADQIILTALSRYLAKKNQSTFIDLQEICITPAGGAPNVPYFAYLCSMEQMNSVALLDSDREGDSAFSKIERDGLFDVSKVVRIKEVAGKSKDDFLELEDLIDRLFYHSAFLKAYKELPGITFAEKLPTSYEEMMNKLQSQTQASTAQEPSAESGHTNNTGEQQSAPKAQGKKRVVNQQLEARNPSSQYSQLFKKHEDERWGDFDKVLVARKVAQELDDNEVLDEQSLSMFEHLFELINGKLGLQ